MQHENTRKGTFVTKPLAESAPGQAQTPAVSHIEADVEAIRELQERIEHLWGNLATSSREELSARLDLLGTAADHRATDSRSVREALQDVLLSIGTGALAALRTSTAMSKIGQTRTVGSRGLTPAAHPVPDSSRPCRSPDVSSYDPTATQSAGDVH